MSDFSILNELYLLIHNRLKSDAVIGEKITSIHEALPKTVSLPYVRLYFNSYRKSKVVSNTMIYIGLMCDVCASHSCALFEIIESININLENYIFNLLGLDCKVTQRDSYSIDYIGENIIKASIQFLIIIDKKSKIFEFKVKLLDNFTCLSGIDSFKIMCRNESIDIHNVKSSGWRNAFNNYDNKCISFHIQGFLDNFSVHDLLYKNSLSNNSMYVELFFDGQRSISTKCTIKMYDKFYDSEDSGRFNILLISEGEIIT